MPYKKCVIICKSCKKDHLASKPSVKYCGISCYNKDTKTKGIDGYKQCEVCLVAMPYRNSLKVRGNKKIKSVNSKFCSNECRIYSQTILHNPMKKEGVKEKMSLLAKTRDHSQLRTKEAVLKRARTISGSNHWNWQGGITLENKRRRNLAEYQTWRKLVFERDDYTCQFCGVRGGYLEADHIKPWAYFPKLRLDINNGRTLCKSCHKTTNTYGAKNRSNEVE